MIPQNILITGGAGFIGSHLVDRLVQMGKNVTVFDSMSKGMPENIKKLLEDKKIILIKGDLLKQYDLRRITGDFDYVFHMAANPDVKRDDPEVHFEENLHATFNMLEFMRKKDIKNILFFSSSVVYGDAKIIPTPEDYSPILPISLYGASKIACENLISAYCYSYGFNATILRLANIIGPRSTLSVVVDFVKKLKADPNKMEILGDGTQDKSFLYVDDLIEAIFTSLDAKERINIFNVGSEDKIKIIDVAKIVAKEMGLDNVLYQCTGGIDGGRGWRGDVKFMQLSIEKLKTIGWTPKYSSEEAVRLTVKALKDDKYEK